VLPRLEAGERLALASDAGLPALNDPGARLIAAAIEQGIEVTVLPGPSAIETALVASGLVGDRYSFVGYVPRERGARERLWAETAGWPGPVVAFESPRRLPATLASLAAARPDRPIAVCRELTKRFEEVVRGPAGEVADRFREAPKGEVTLVLGPASRESDAGLADALAVMADLADAGLPRRRAAELVSRLTGLPRNRLYRGSL
jgi:16S rRNA (cytidine1402-2'-O)-methyltransferase